MKKIYAFIIIFAFIIPLPTAFATDEIKTNEFFVGDSESQITSQVDKTFSIYIGDDLSGVTTPVESAYFTVSGVYTGTSGTLELKINSDAATSKTFTLADASSPTPFEIIYQDTVSKINPTAAGTYSYTLNVIPTNLTISGFSAKINITYRHTTTSCYDGDSTDEKIKTTEFFVGDSESQISSLTDKSFSVYVGDDITGVSSSLKSAYITVSGVYTSTGVSPSLQLQLNSDSNSSKIFSFPTASNPTPFEVVYQDDSEVINLTTSGIYGYTLGITPANMVISGLGAVATLSHRYQPPSCAGGLLPATGELTSSVFDTTASSDGPAYNSIMWKGTLSNGSGKVRFQLATSNSESGPWNFVGGATCALGDWYDPGDPDTPVEITCAPDYHNNQRYFKYKVQICSESDCTSQSVVSPQVDDVVVNWSP